MTASPPAAGPPALTARAASALAAAALLLCASPGAARAETFVFRDPSRPQARGKVLAEFQDLLFVALDEGGRCFLLRADLEAVVDEAGQRYESPVPGAFGPLQGPSPLGALTQVEGEVRHGAGPPLGPGSLVFLKAGDSLRTGETGLLRLVFPSGATCKVGPASEVVLPGARAEEHLTLERGEAWVETRGRAVSLPLPGGALVSVQSDSSLLCRRSGPRGARIVLHAGQGEASAPGLRAVLEPGLGLLLEPGEGKLWRLEADAANHGPVRVVHREDVHLLRPGESRVFGGAVEPEGGPWRLLRASGDLSLRRGPRGPFQAVPPGAAREGLVLGALDALRTGAPGGATIVRQDGASAALRQATALQVLSGPGGPLDLLQGGVDVEVAETPVGFSVPGGEAALRLVVLRLERAGDDLDARCLAGAAQLPLGPWAAAWLEAGAEGRLQDPPVRGAQDAPPVMAFRLAAGRGTIASRAPPAGGPADARGPAAGGPADVVVARGDPGFRVVLRPTVPVGVREDPQGPVLLLPGERELCFEAGEVGAEVGLDPEVRVVLRDPGVHLDLAPGLRLGLLREGAGPPALHLRSGPRLGLSSPGHLGVHDRSVEVRGAEGVVATWELQGDFAARLLEGRDLAASALQTRVPEGPPQAGRPAEADRLEVPHGGRAVVDRHRELTRCAWPDLRRLWIQDGAPPVHARLVDAKGELFLSMPGAQGLGLPPGRPLTVLATKEGELVILDQDALARAGLLDLDYLTALGAGAAESIARDRIRDLLDVPFPDSPSGP